MKPLTYGSVCSGIEAATAAWHVLGWKPAWFAEIEPFPSAVLAHHYPHVANLGDMTKIAMLVRMGLVDAPDVLVGGTPCQAFSVAGLRGGLVDPRGQLTLAYADLANAIDEKRPGDECVIYWENVPGVLSSKDNAFGCFLGLLAGEDSELEPEAKPVPGKSSEYWKWNINEQSHTCRWPNVGCVYGPQRAIAWRILDAQYFGVAQRRRRVFVVASARAGFDPAKLLFESDGMRRDIAPSRETGQDTSRDIAPCLTSSRLQRIGDPTGQDAVIACMETAPTLRASGVGTERVGDTRGQDCVIPVICPTLRAGGNQTGGDRPPGTDVDTADSLIVVMAHGQGGAEISVGLRPTLTCNHEAPIAAYSIAGNMINRNINAGPGGTGVDASGVSFTLTKTDVHAVAFVDVTPTLTSNGDAHSGFRDENGLVPVCVTGNVTHTLKAEGFDASEDGTGRGQPIIAAFKGGQGEKAGGIGYSEHVSPTLSAGDSGSNRTPVLLQAMAVRRLTPRECERLQGFPDDYTLVPVKGKPAADGPRYKALGNSMARPCMEWLGMRLIVTHPEMFIERLAA